MLWVSFGFKSSEQAEQNINSESRWVPAVVAQQEIMYSDLIARGRVFSMRS